MHLSESFDYVNEDLPYGVVKVSLHELEHQVEIFIVFGTNHLLQLHNVRVLKFLEKDYFAVGALGVG